VAGKLPAPMGPILSRTLQPAMEPIVLRPGPSTYTISEESKSGWVQTYPPSPGTWSVALTQYQTVTNKDFGNYYCNLSVSIDTPDKQLNCTGPCPILKAVLGPYSGSGGFNYTWYNNSITIEGATNPQFTACYPGRYNVTVYNLTAPKCYATSNILVIMPKVDPTATIDTPDKQLNCTGPCPIITATVGGIQDSDALYQWYNNSEKIADETSKTFVACYPGSYTFNVTNTTTGCKNITSPVVIKDKIIPTATIDTPDKQLNCTGPCPIITATVGGIQESDALYQWYNNSEEIAGAIYKTFDACYPGSYTFNVTNTTTKCKNITSAVVIKPKPSVSCELTADAIVCENKTGFVAYVPEQTGVTYQWTVTGDGEAVSGSGTYQLIWKSKLNQTGSVQIAVAVTNTSTGCSCSNATTVKVQSEPSAYGGSDKTTCATDSVQLEGVAGNYSEASWGIISGPGSLTQNGITATFVPAIDPSIIYSQTILAFNATAKSPCSSKPATM